MQQVDNSLLPKNKNIQQLGNRFGAFRLCSKFVKSFLYLNHFQDIKDQTIHLFKIMNVIRSQLKVPNNIGGEAILIATYMILLTRCHLILLHLKHLWICIRNLSPLTASLSPILKILYCLSFVDDHNLGPLPFKCLCRILIKSKWLLMFFGSIDQISRPFEGYSPSSYTVNCRLLYKGLDCLFISQLEDFSSLQLFILL